MVQIFSLLFLLLFPSFLIRFSCSHSGGAVIYSFPLFQMVHLCSPPFSFRFLADYSIHQSRFIKFSSLVYLILSVALFIASLFTCMRPQLQLSRSIVHSFLFRVRFPLFAYACFLSVFTWSVIHFVTHSIPSPRTAHVLRCTQTQLTAHIDVLKFHYLSLFGTTIIHVRTMYTNGNSSAQGVAETLLSNILSNTLFNQSRPVIKKDSSLFSDTIHYPPLLLRISRDATSSQQVPALLSPLFSGDGGYKF